MDFIKRPQRGFGVTRIITDLLPDSDKQRRREFEEQMEKIKQTFSIRNITFTTLLLLSIVLFMAVPELGTAGIGISIIGFLLGIHERRTKEKELRQEYRQHL